MTVIIVWTFQVNNMKKLERMKFIAESKAIEQVIHNQVKTTCQKWEIRLVKMSGRKKKKPD